jgi:tRNA(Arg) A34 adenosine deaminase TadA
MSSLALVIELPEWLAEYEGERIEGDEPRMRRVLQCAERNVRNGAGGPFAAGVFDLQDGSLTALGVNVVVPATCSVAHAEMIALARAEQRVGSARLADAGAFALYTTAQPCSMCYGALPWAGLARLVCGARRTDVERLTGFDEGPLPHAWTQELERRGTAVARDVLRAECCEVLRAYRRNDGKLY